MSYKDTTHRSKYGYTPTYYNVNDLAPSLHYKIHSRTHAKDNYFFEVVVGALIIGVIIALICN